MFVKFIDLVKITVIAGKGGDGGISFQKKRGKNWISKPDGSNGGDGGDVWLSADTGINTLNDFRFKRVFTAQHGARGYRKNCTGKKGKNLIIKVPLGTRVRCQQTHEILGDLIGGRSTTLMIAKGGQHGLGNSHFKSSFKNSGKRNANLVRYRTCGSPGELRHLLLELILIADVGVFGLPNSGKSSFLNIISKAKPKIADYPFTTLTPNLGVMQTNDYDNIIFADIPGIIKGAATGLGLGIQFLKHLERCSMLLHFVDIKPADNTDPIENILVVEEELLRYGAGLHLKKRWLVFNKIDLIKKCQLYNKINQIIQLLAWKDRFYAISVKNRIHITSLCNDISQFISGKTIINNITKFRNNTVSMMEK